MITSNLAGSGAVIIAGAANRFPYVLFVTDQIKKIEELKGKKFGVSRIGSADNAAAATVWQTYGSDATVTMASISSVRGDVRMFEATLLQAPETLKARSGLRALLDFTKLDVEWQQNGVATTRDYIKKKPDTVRRFMRAMLKRSTIILPIRRARKRFYKSISRSKTTNPSKRPTTKSSSS